MISGTSASPTSAQGGAVTRRAKAVSLCEGRRALIGVPNALFWPDSGACIDLRGGRLSTPNLSKLAAHQSDEHLLYLRIVQQTQEDLFESLGLLCLISADALGAHQLVFNVAGVAFMVPLGLAQAATVRVAYQLGQQKPDGAGRAGFVALVLGGLFMLGSAVVLWTVPRLLIGFYV